MNQENHKIEDIIRIFNQCFANEYNTRLERGVIIRFTCPNLWTKMVCRANALTM